MRYITLTDECVNFGFSSNSNDLKLVWNVPHDFSEIPFIGIHSFHLSELETKNHDSHIRLSTNLITRTITNPKRNILDQSLEQFCFQFMTHFNGKSMSGLASGYENNLRSLVEGKDCQLTLTQSQRFVPSFHEVWLFYQVWSITQSIFKLKDL